jgi:hypothetical protein
VTPGTPRSKDLPPTASWFRGSWPTRLFDWCAPNSLSAIYIIGHEPREEDDLIASKAWLFRPYMKVISEYLKSLEKYPNPPGASLTKFGRQ